jgi:hypothetical protein
LDEFLPQISTDLAMLLVDVEGSEPEVLRGGLNLIRKLQPLIIFEYNDAVSKKCYPISEIQAILGDAYSLHRLRGDGRLDQDVEHAWNCVAIPAGTPWAAVCRPLLVEGAG